MESGSGPGGWRFKSSLPDQLFSISYSFAGRPTGISPGALPLETAKTLALSESLRACTAHDFQRVGTMYAKGSGCARVKAT